MGGKGGLPGGTRQGIRESSIKSGFVKVALVPLAGIEPALLAELDFESSASTNSATGACEACRFGANVV